MNEDHLIHEALQEHSRLGNQADEVFLAELEEQLDEAQTQSIASDLSKSKRRWYQIGVVSTSFAASLALILSLKELFQPDIDFPAKEEETVQLELPDAGVARSIGFSSSSSYDRERYRALSETSNSRVASVPQQTRPKFFFASENSSRPPDPQISLRQENGYFSQIKADQFISVTSDPLSTFSIDVDTASYTLIRKSIESGIPISPDSVRIEEMINFFDYDYPYPEGKHPIAIHTETASCPWNEKHRLVKIGLQGKSIEQTERKPTNLVFLIDVSGSMSASDKLPLLRESFQLLLAELNEKDQISIVVYAGHDAVLLEPTAMTLEGRRKARQVLDSLNSGGGTHGSSGIKTAYDLARQAFRKNGTNRVILATDGDFNIGVTGSHELLRLVKQRADDEIYLSILGLGTYNLNDAMMENLTNHANGNYFYLDSIKEGKRVFQKELASTLETIAKDTKIQVEFNPTQVSQYRLIGYENRHLRNEDFRNDRIDAGDIGAGHQVTALYEIIPTHEGKVSKPLKYQPTVDPDPSKESPELLTVSLRYKTPGSRSSKLIEHPVTDSQISYRQSSQDFRFASSVALWGMSLKNLETDSYANTDLIKELVKEVTDPDQTEFRKLVNQWSSH